MEHSSHHSTPIIPEHCKDVPISSSRYLAGWKIAGRPVRHKYKGNGTVPKPEAEIHREFKPSKGKKGNKVPPVPQVYNNKLFSSWQNEMARSIHMGHNVVADVVTSCGKTWAANLIVSHEVLSRDRVKGGAYTALIVSPNAEVMRETVCDIRSWHVKHYNYPTTKTMDTITRNFSTYDEKRGSIAQIMVVAVECIEEFITDPVNADWISRLRIIVFDEVHLGPVTRALWWSKFIPHSAQLVLLSATLGDPEEVRSIVADIQACQGDRPRETDIIKYNVRPIPLQPLVFKGSELPESGPYSANLKGAKKLTCLINKFDPTTRDLMSLMQSASKPAEIPEDRDAQFFLGQQVIQENDGLVEEKLHEALQNAEVNATPENIYSLICYLFSNDKAPLMAFNTTSGATEKMVRALIAYIAQVEMSDPEYKEARKQMDVYEKEQYRARDKKDNNKARVKDKENWNKAMPDDPNEGNNVINIIQVRKSLRKWRFPSDITDIPDNIPDNIPQWIRDALDYGIGIYVSHMSVRQRHMMFDAFRNGDIKVLFSDSTISVGINLPIRTVIMFGTMSQALYKQASGRAGRRGMDNQGYIVHMMPKQDIVKCMTRKTPEVHLDMPYKMTHADLINTLIPLNLQTYYGDPPYDRNLKVQPVKVEFDNNCKRISEYSRKILENYLKSLKTETDRDECLKQINQLHKEQWHYHRLTHIVKTLPHTASIIMVKMLAMGKLHDFTVLEFIDLMALLFNRVEQGSIGIDDTNSDHYYIPETELLSSMVTASRVYGIDIDLSKPIHRYFNDFCHKQIVHVEFLDKIIDMGEWLYTLKVGVLSVSPMQGRGKNAIPTDKFAKLIKQVDNLYLAARASQSI